MSNFSAETVAEITEKLRAASENSTRMHEAGLAAGAKSEYDAFWDTFQNYGNKTHYDFTFAESGVGNPCWNDGTTFRPKYSIAPRSAVSMFHATRLPYEAIKLVDFAECTDFYNTFQYSAPTRLPTIDMSKGTRVAGVFSNMNRLEKIDEVIMSANTPCANIFTGCTALRDVKFSGKISQSGLDLSACTKLLKDSIESIFNCLDYYAVGKSIVFSKVAVDKAYETSEGANDGSDSSLWCDDRVDNYSNWTIVLV